MPFIRYRCSGIQYLQKDSVLPCSAVHTLQCTAHCTLSAWSSYLAVLVTDPPNANLNQLQNPPIGQATTFQFHCQD